MLWGRRARVEVVGGGGGVHSSRSGSGSSSSRKQQRREGRKACPPVSARISSREPSSRFCTHREAEGGECEYACVRVWRRQASTARAAESAVTTCRSRPRMCPARAPGSAGWHLPAAPTPCAHKRRPLRQQTQQTCPGGRVGVWLSARLGGGERALAGRQAGSVRVCSVCAGGGGGGLTCSSYTNLPEVSWKRALTVWGSACARGTRHERVGV